MQYFGELYNDKNGKYTRKVLTLQQQCFTVTLHFNWHYVR